MITNSSIQQPTLAIAPHIQQQAWTQSQFDSSWAQWNHYLNRVCVNTVLPWMQAECDAQVTFSFQDWMNLNGSAIAFGQKQLILIPDLSIDMSEIRVPQFWVDDAVHTGDYYFAIQVNPDDSWIKIWGYTTHQQVKAIGAYDARDRCYCLPSETLILDIAVFQVVQRLCPNKATRFVESN